MKNNFWNMPDKPIQILDPCYLMQMKKCVPQNKEVYSALKKLVQDHKVNMSNKIFNFSMAKTTSSPFYLKEDTKCEPTFIIAPRGGGKTAKLIQKAEEYNAVIVVSDGYRAMDVADYAKQLGHKILKPVTFENFIDNRGNGHANTKYFIDDADQFLKCMCQRNGGHLGYYSITDNCDTNDIAMEEHEKRFQRFKEGKG